MALDIDDPFDETTRNTGHRTPLASSVVGLSSVVVGLVISITKMIPHSIRLIKKSRS